ncbi:MAG: UDP-N-acetylmuramoyl-L-alanine--D-glutamate ligase [Ruminococcaceae bacterium]|nr:UDP-N-acetylmuramoyl-L-alanine--D-glutamate ligase [Oscillospiraceae bacterium]
MNISDLKGKRVTVCGIGISNLPLIYFLLSKGATVSARDRKSRDKMEDTAKELEEKGVKLILGEDYLEDINEEIIFRSPGIRYDKPQLCKAVENGALLTSEMQLFFELCPAAIIGITGSDGKTTTTTLISKLIEMQYGKVYVGGNIGRPLLPLVEEMGKDDYAVVELSSFQLHTMTLSPKISVVTNISPNHLDYHKDMEEYIDAKKNIFLNPGNERLVINAKNAVTAKFADFARDGAETVPFLSEEGVYEKDGTIFYGDDAVLETKDILIPGRHNVENYMAAVGALYGIVDKKNFVELAKTFGGVEHRIELIRELDGVKYYNSSIDSSPSRTAAALNSFGSKLIVICGGYDKQIPFEPLADVLCKKAKVVVLTGATAGKIKAALLAHPDFPSSGICVIEESDFTKAVNAAQKAAVSGDTVILSPACASFDAFPNFEVRGRRFKEIVLGF